MRLSFTLAPICAAMLAGPVLAADACAWAGGAYSFKERGVYGELNVNADCTQITWKRLQEPETATLKRTRHGWRASLKKVDVELLENGSSLRIYDGGIMRQASAEPKG